MSAILKMLEASNRGDIDFYPKVQYAIPDILRLVSWVESTKHASGCRIYFPPMGTASMSAEGKFESNIMQPSVCTCGLDEIQSLLRS